MGMKVYVLKGGIAPDMPRELLIGSGGSIDPADVVPIPTTLFLIDHPAGLILYDTGWTKPQRFALPWTVPENDLVLNSLGRLGVSPHDIRYVICSHLHLDHAGNLEEFAKSEIIVSDSEFTNVMKQYALNRLGRSYIRADIEEWLRVGLHWRLINEESDMLTWLDNIHILSFGSGHSYGMLGLLLELPTTGNVIIASDAINCSGNVGPPVRPPAGVLDREGYVSILDRIVYYGREYRAQIWYGHDMEQFESLVKSDEGWYD